MRKIWVFFTDYLHSTDRWLLFFSLAASGASILFLCGIYNSGLMDGNSKIVMQVMAIGLGLFFAVLLSCIDYNSLLKLWKLYMPACVALVLITLTWGVVRGENQAWLYIPVAGRVFSLQPSELLKISFITTFALHIDKVKENLNNPLTTLLLLLHGGAHTLLVQQGDTGSALIFLAIFIIMIFCAGLSWKYIAAAAVTLFLTAPLIWLNFLTDEQRVRILVMFHPDTNPDKVFQQLRGAIALGTGGLKGTGIFSGRHVPVPEVYNDFIISFIGESSGFIGALGVILLLAAIGFRMLYISTIAKDDVGRMICIGVCGMFFAQMLINLGMCLRILPVIGVTLPFLSQGGTSTLSMYGALGLVLSVYRHSSTALFYNNTSR